MHRTPPQALHTSHTPDRTASVQPDTGLLSSSAGVAARVVSITGIAGVLMVAGCNQGNPFATEGRDFGEKTTRERLREIGTADLPAIGTPRAKPISGEAELQNADAVRARFAGLAKTTLTLENARASVIKNNLDLRVAIIDPAIARERVNEEEARFNSAFTLRSAWSNLDDATSSSLDSAQSEFRTIEPGVRIPMRTGGSVNVTLPVAKRETDNQFTLLNPSYTSDVEFSISHNLLRNAGRRANTASLRIAGYDAQAVEAQTKLEVIRQIAAADRAYWRLYLVRAELDVRLQQYDVAVAQRDRAQRRVNAGALSEIEVTRSDAGISERLEAIIAAQNALRIQQRELKRIINSPELPVESQTIIETSSPPDPLEFDIDPVRACAAAVENRMEMLALELRLAADAASIDLQRNRALPLLTLDYTYRVNGLGGSMQDSFHTLQRNNYTDWEVGLNFEVPLDNEEAKARIRQALLARVQRLSSREARAQAIRQETLNAIDTIEGTYQRIAAARQSVILNTRTLVAEQRQFDVGRSTSTDVLDAAARVADAQSAEIRALVDHQIAQIDLAFATGTLLGAAKVEWEPLNAPPLDSPTPDEVVPGSGAVPEPSNVTP